MALVFLRQGMWPEDPMDGDFPDSMLCWANNGPTRSHEKISQGVGELVMTPSQLRSGWCIIIKAASFTPSLFIVFSHFYIMFGFLPCSTTSLIDTYLNYTHSLLFKCRKLNKVTVTIKEHLLSCTVLAAHLMTWGIGPNCYIIACLTHRQEQRGWRKNHRYMWYLSLWSVWPQPSHSLDDTTN